jgi:exo-beta-1,3-glucanase (GH17 family)
MRLYIYYNKFDSTEEPYGVIETTSLTEAIDQAATIKQMDINTFLEIFNVKPKPDGKHKVQKHFGTSR